MKRLIGYFIIAVLFCSIIYAAEQVKCPVCGSNSYFTGETKADVSGKVLYKYQCMMYQDHKFWVAK